jgi:hypothetical protein
MAAIFEKKLAHEAAFQAQLPAVFDGSRKTPQSHLTVPLPNGKRRLLVTNPAPHIRISIQERFLYGRSSTTGARA